MDPRLKERFVSCDFPTFQHLVNKVILKIKLEEHHRRVTMGWVAPNRRPNNIQASKFGTLDNRGPTTMRSLLELKREVITPTLQGRCAREALC